MKNIGSVKEDLKVEKRISITPETVKKLIDLKFSVSLEKNYGRAKILGSNLARLKLNAQIINKDAILWKPPKLANAVIIDAPCSATGTIRKNPDILWKMVFNQEKTKEKIKLLLKLQKKLLLSASHMIGTNGILIYSVCSLEPEEGQEQISNFLNINKNFKIIPIKPEDIDIPIDAITKEGFLQTLPFMFSNKGGMDSFFVARLKKNH